MSVRRECRRREMSGVKITEVGPHSTWGDTGALDGLIRLIMIYNFKFTSESLKSYLISYMEFHDYDTAISVVIATTDDFLDGRAEHNSLISG